jgi:HEAT repeat protein
VHRHTFPHFACITLLAACADPQDAEVSAPPPTHPATNELRVEIDGGAVTVHARDATLRDIVEEIARSTGLVLVLQDPLDERIDVDLHSLPLSEALHRILREWSFALQHAAQPSRSNESRNARAGTLWIFRKGSERSRASLSIPLADGMKESGGAHEVETIERLSVEQADDDANTRIDAVSALADVGGSEAAAMLAVTALHDANASVRAEALYALGGRDDADGLTFWPALNDADADVRRAAISALEDIRGEASVELLAIALNDEDALVRAAAVDALGEVGGETAIRLLRQTSNDEQSAVREAAAELLDATDLQSRKSAATAR